MYRLTVVAGPSRGTSYPLHEGETTLGRLSSNSICLPSSKVSQRHCVLAVSGEEIVCKDQGSTNGTFINGILTKTPRQMQIGDRMTIGDFVFELSSVSTQVVRDPLALPANIAAIGGNPVAMPTVGERPAGLTGMSKVASVSQADVMPQDFKSRMLWIFDRRLMPHLYRLLLKYEWRTLLFASYAAFTVIAIIFAVAPLIQSNEVLMIRELERRAQFMARLLVESNQPYIQQKAETKTDVPDSIQKGYGVRQAFLMDLDNRILAPPSKLNQYLTSGPAATAAIKAKQEFLEKGRVKTVLVPVGSHTVVAVEPMILFSPSEGRNIPVAMGVVALDATLVTAGFGDVLLIFSESLIWLGFFGLILALVVYRLTLKPLEILHDEMDRSLKSENPEELSKECKFEELGQLQDLIQSLVRRVASVSSGEQAQSSGSQSVAIGEECLGAFQAVGDLVNSGMVFCDSDRRVLYMNPAFDDLSGIRTSNAVGNTLSDQARSQAFSLFLTDLFDRASTQGMAQEVGEEFEFNGTPHRVRVIPLGASGAAPRGYLLITQRSDHG
ncbi:MAG: hypothetical protein RJB38_1792 [Pseudomonadota bacterium]|jgi:PAS domain-containing protein